MHTRQTEIMSALFKNQTTTAPAPAASNTTYESPSSTLLNYSSSVLNGVTAEGGLFSLTFKSMSCYKLVENLDIMRELLVSSHEVSNQNQVCETKSCLQDLLLALENNENTSQESNKTPSLEISLVHKMLDKYCQQPTNFERLKSKLPDSVLSLQSPASSMKKHITFGPGITIPGLEVTSIDDLSNADMNVYHKYEEAS